MDPPKNHGLLRVCVRVKLGHGNVGFVASRLTIPTTSLMARKVPKHHTCKSLRIKGDDRPEAKGQAIDADLMRASSRFRATLQIGQRQRHLIS
jgi:hypothetical protein